MKPMISIAACAVALATALSAANVVGGKVSIVTKRGQKPVISETLIWLEPTGSKSPKPVATRFQMVTRGKMVLPHVLAIPVGSYWVAGPPLSPWPEPPRSTSESPSSWD